MKFRARISSIVFLAGMLFALSLAAPSCVFAQKQTDDISLWSRGDKCYLCRESSMPVWPVIPNRILDRGEPFTLEVEMPEGFEITAWGSSKAFALHPKPLMIPGNMESQQKGDKVVYKIEFPAKPAKLTDDNLNFKEKDKCVRAAIMINPGDAEEGEYPLGFKILAKDGEVLSRLDAAGVVLPALKGKTPERMRVEVFDYAGYKNPEFKKEFKKIILKAGINQMSNMRYYDSNDTVAQQLRNEGVNANWLLFWHRHSIDDFIAEKYPEVRPLDKNGEPKDEGLCHTWCIKNSELVKDRLKEFIKKKVVGKYDGVTNDNEEKALTRKTGEPRGDLYTPMTLELFHKRAGIEEDVELTPEVIAEKYADEWVDFRCWQSAKMSSILSQALLEVDPGIAYGYYSGHKYVGDLAGFSKSMYATDWEMLARLGGIHFGSSGYYGSVDDYAATTEALDPIPHIPAEMFIENFVSFGRDMPEPDIFTYRLMNSLMYGSGGFAVWYAQVLDGAAFHSISRVASITAQIEDFLLDGTRCDQELALGANVDKNAVFAYRLGAKRLVVLLNHSGKKRIFRYGWKKDIIKPDTVEIVSGKNYGDSQFFTVQLEPKSFAVFITLSEGN